MARGFSAWPEENSCLREIIVESMVQEESSPVLCLERIIDCAPFFQDGPCSVDLV